MLGNIRVDYYQNKFSLIYYVDCKYLFNVNLANIVWTLAVKVGKTALFISCFKLKRVTGTQLRGVDWVVYQIRQGLNASFWHKFDNNGLRRFFLKLTFSFLPIRDWFPNYIELISRTYMLTLHTFFEFFKIGLVV